MKIPMDERTEEQIERTCPKCLSLNSYFSNKKNVHVCRTCGTCWETVRT